MTYPAIKKHNKSSQEGVTLFLGILVLSSLLAISFSLATILFIEVRTSSDLTKTEGALAGANGVAEQALYNIKRDVDCGTTCYIANFSNHVALKEAPASSTIASPSFVDKVLPSSISLLGTLNKYDFCATNTPPDQGCGYGKVTITYEPSGNTDSLVVNLCEFDATGFVPYSSAPCTDLSDDYWLTGHAGVFLNSNDPPLSFTFTAGYQQVLILYNNSPSPSENIYVQIQTFANDGTTAKGLPYANKTSVSINAINGQVGRKIKVVVPNAPGNSSGVSSSGTHSIWSSSAVPSNPYVNDPTAVRLGVKFKSDSAGVITAIKFYKDPQNLGPHTGRLYDDAGTLLGTVAFTGETASGWQTANFSSPIAISANTVYVATYENISNPSSGYAQDSGYFSSGGFDNPPLHALSTAEDSGNGVCNYFTLPPFSAGYGTDCGSNFWVDVVFE